MFYRFVLAAVSPAVVVPSLLNLSDRGYGLNKGIPTLVIAAASIDDVIAITGFGVVLGIAFSSGKYISDIVLILSEYIGAQVNTIEATVVSIYSKQNQSSEIENVFSLRTSIWFLK